MPVLFTTTLRLVTPNDVQEAIRLCFHNLYLQEYKNHYTREKI